MFKLRLLGWHLAEQGEVKDRIVASVLRVGIRTVLRG